MVRIIIFLWLMCCTLSTLDAMQPHLFQPEIIENGSIKANAVIDHEVIIIGLCFINSDVTFSKNGHIVIYPESTLELQGYPRGIVLKDLKKNSIIFSDDTSWIIISPKRKVTLTYLEKPEYSTGRLIVAHDAKLRIVSPWPKFKNFFGAKFNFNVHPGARVFCDLPPISKTLYTLPKQ